MSWDDLGHMATRQQVWNVNKYSMDKKLSSGNDCSVKAAAIHLNTDKILPRAGKSWVIAQTGSRWSKLEIKKWH